MIFLAFQELWKDKKCYNCGKTGHPASHFQNNSKDTTDKKEDEEKSRTSRSSKSRRPNKSNINNLTKAMKQSFTTSEEKLDELENEVSNLDSSEREDIDGY